MPAGVIPQMKFSVCQANNCAEMRFTEISDYGSYYPSEITKVELTVEKPTTYSSGVMDVTTDIVYTLTGTLTCTGTTAITGVGTLFTSELVVGDRIYEASTNTYATIASISNDTTLTLTAAGSAYAGQTGYRKRETIVIDPADLGMSGTFPDGSYYMLATYTMSDATTHEWEREFFFHCHVNCGVFTMLGKVPQYYDCENCNNEFIISAVTVHGLYKAMLWHAAKCNFTQATEILTTLNNILEFNNCNCD